MQHIVIKLNDGTEIVGYVQIDHENGKLTCVDENGLIFIVEQWYED